uniref:RAWUL domain-containing protein n=1 Tax=Acrobeloides nanus TaxID=290746 RepID=A0A914D8X5_9BILA
MQDIVYKLVPGMQEQEAKRRIEFNQQKRLERGEDSEEDEEYATQYMNGTSDHATEPQPTSHDENCCENNPAAAHHRLDDAVVIELVPGDKSIEPLERPYIRLSGFATINTIKRYVALILLHDLTKYNDFDIFCNNELMGRDYSMAFILKTRWRNKPKDEPLKLLYKAHIDF